MRTIVVALALAASHSPACGQVPSIVDDYLQTMRPRTTNVDQVRAQRAEAIPRLLANGLPFDAQYWDERMAIAEFLDRGALSPERAAVFVEDAYQRHLTRIAAQLRAAETDRQQAAIDAEQARISAQREAMNRSANRSLIELGLGILWANQLNTPAYTPPVTCFTTPNGRVTTCR